MGVKLLNYFCKGRKGRSPSFKGPVSVKDNQTRTPGSVRRGTSVPRRYWCHWRRFTTALRKKEKGQRDLGKDERQVDTQEGKWTEKTTSVHGLRPGEDSEGPRGPDPGSHESETESSEEWWVGWGGGVRGHEVKVGTSVTSDVYGLGRRHGLPTLWG